jgi:hypothetical protein
MPLTRRRFLRASALSALAAGCALGPARAFGQDLTRSSPAQDFQIPFEATQSPVYYYTQETFEPYVGGTFRGTLNGSSVWLQLLSVKGYEPAAGTKIMTRQARETRSFTLTFRAGRSLTELTDVHKLEHAALGKFELLMARSINPHGHIFYEAVINHVA